MVNEETTQSILLKLFTGIIIYFAVINILIYIQYGIPFTPREWLLNPLHNLIVEPNILSWVIFIFCEIGGWFLFERK